jgi:hypothetical protein
MPMGLGLRGLYRGHIDLDTQVGNIYIYICVIPTPIPHPPHTLCDVVGIPAGAFFFSEKMTSLEISDMHFDKFDVFCQYLGPT